MSSRTKSPHPTLSRLATMVVTLSIVGSAQAAPPDRVKHPRARQLAAELADAGGRLAGRIDRAAARAAALDSATTRLERLLAAGRAGAVRSALSELAQVAHDAVEGVNDAYAALADLAAVRVVILREGTLPPSTWREEALLLLADPASTAVQNRLRVLGAAWKKLSARWSSAQERSRALARK